MDVLRASNLMTTGKESIVVKHGRKAVEAYCERGEFLKSTCHQPFRTASNMEVTGDGSREGYFRRDISKL